MIKNKSNVKRIPLLLCTLFIVAMMISLINPLHVHAKTSLVQAIVDSISSDSTAGNQKVQNGINVNRTGYLVYLLDIETKGEVSGDNGLAKVYALRPTECNNFIGGDWLCKPRKGYQNNSASYWHNMEKAPDGKSQWWDMTPWHMEGGDPKTNEEEIKAWMLDDNGAGTENVVAFVSNLWKDDGITEQFKSNQIALVVETILNLQFSTSSKGISDAEKAKVKWELNKIKRKDLKAALKYLYNFELPVQVQVIIDNLNLEYVHANTMLKGVEKNKALRKLKSSLANAVDELEPYILEELEKKSSTYELQGDCPVYGTLNNLAEYKQSVLHLEKSALDSYTNRYACFAEYIEKDGIGEQVGFTAWNGAPSNSNISNSDVMTYGLGMMVIQANSGSASTHTWDHPLDKVIPITTKYIKQCCNDIRFRNDDNI